MKRQLGSVVAGYVVWTAIWLGGNAVLFSEAADAVNSGEAYTQSGPLAGVIALSVVCSLAAGGLTAAIARDGAARSVVIMSLLLLATGIGVQAGAWSLMPIWYHLTFLALLVPAAVIGGRLVAGAGLPQGEPTL